MHRVLMLTHRLPYAPNKGDRLRAYHLIREMSRWAVVDLVSFADSVEEATQVDRLVPWVERMRVLPRPRIRNLVRGVGALATRHKPLTHALLDAPGVSRMLSSLVVDARPDLVFAFCSGTARLAMEPALRSIPLVVDLVDVDSAKWRALSHTATFPLSGVYAREARVLGRFEQQLAKRARRLLVVNDKEREALLALAPGAAVEVVPNGVDLEAFAPTRPPEASPRVVFCGVMDYAPNVEAARWIATEVWPRIRKARPDAELQLVGSSPSPAVRALHAPSAGITVTGTVPDVRPYLWNAAVAAAPLRTARGIQNKVLEAVAAGTPCIVTPAVAAGLPAEVLPACMVAEAASEFAGRIMESLSLTPSERRARASRAVLDGLRWPSALARLRSIMHAALASPVDAWEAA